MKRIFSIFFVSVVLAVISFNTQAAQVVSFNKLPTGILYELNIPGGSQFDHFKYIRIQRSEYLPPKIAGISMKEECGKPWADMVSIADSVESTVSYLKDGTSKWVISVSIRNSDTVWQGTYKGVTECTAMEKAVAFLQSPEKKQ